MSDQNHAIVWIDHSEARILRFGAGDVFETDVHSHTSLQRLHHSRTGWEAGGNPPDDTEFFKRILGALEQSGGAVGHPGGTVITGPGNAKSALKTFLDRVWPGVPARVFAVESEDHPEAAALLALGRRYFPAGVMAPAARDTAVS
jgi:stalled ribosome rescue protein Dom34